MASISKISTQIVADARQFNSTLTGAGKLAESIFARMAKLEFIPGVKTVGLKDRLFGKGPVKVGVVVDRGDSLQAFYDLLDKARTRATGVGSALSRALNFRMPDTIRVPMIDNRNSVGPVMPLKGSMPLTTVSKVSFTKLPDQGPGPFAPRQQYVSDTSDSVKNRVFFPIDEGKGARFKQRTLAVYKSIGEGAKFVGLVIGHAMSHPNLGGAKALGDAWKNSFDRIIPSVRNLYKMVSAPLVLTWHVLGLPDRAVAAVRDRARRVLQGATRSIGSAFSMFVPSPRYAVIGALASVGVSTYQLHEYVEKVSRAAIETKNFGLSAGASASDIQQMQYALRYMGQDAKGAVEALKTIEQLQVTSKIGDYATTDLLSRLGGDAGRMLRTGEDIDDVMKAVNASITAQGGGVRAVALAMHVYGDNAERVLRYALLTNKQRNVLGKQMTAQGNVIDPDTVSVLQQTELTVNRIGLSMEGIVARAVVAFAPAILNGLESLNFALASIDTDLLIERVKGFFFQTVAFVANIPSYFTMAADYIIMALGGISLALDLLSIRLYRLQADANKMMGDFTKSGTLNQKADALEATIKPGAPIDIKPEYMKDANRADASYKRTLAGLTTVANIQKMMEGNVGSSVLAQMSYDASTALMGLMRSKKLLIDGAMQTAREVEQPFEKLKARLNALDLMAGLGKDVMSPSTYGRAVLKAFNEIESGMQLTDIRLPGLARKDSTEAVSAINRSEVEYRLKVADTPAVRQQRILEQSRDILLMIEKYAALSAEAAQQRKIVSLPQ